MPDLHHGVVALLGATGVLSIFAPIQPAVGAAGILVLLWALRRRIRTVQATACPVGPRRAGGHGPGTPSRS